MYTHTPSLTLEALRGASSRTIKSILTTRMNNMFVALTTPRLQQGRQAKKKKTAAKSQKRTPKEKGRDKGREEQHRPRQQRRR